MVVADMVSKEAATFMVVTQVDFMDAVPTSLAVAIGAVAQLRRAYGGYGGYDNGPGIVGSLIAGSLLARCRIRLLRLWRLWRATGGNGLKRFRNRIIKRDRLGRLFTTSYK